MNQNDVNVFGQYFLHHVLLLDYGHTGDGFCLINIVNCLACLYF